MSTSLPAAVIPQDTVEDLGWPRLLEYLADRCHTTLGADAARGLPFLRTPEEARDRITAISEARLLYQLDEPMPFGGLSNVNVALDRVEKGGVLEGTELVAVGKTVAGATVLRRHLLSRLAQVPSLGATAELLADLPHVSGPILDSFEDAGRLADHASAALGPLRRRVAALHEELGRRAKGLLDDPKVAPHLQDNFYTQREERYVVPLRADARAKVKGIVHGTSQSGQTIFVEPEEIVELNNRLKLAESEVEEEEQRILAELSGYVREEVPAIRVSLEAATRLDLLDAAARLADALDASAPEIDASGPSARMELPGARHPLMVLAGRPCVPNDLALGGRTFLVISGPNAGGKTVALKTAGLSALLVRAGLHVPAEVPSRVPWFDQVFTDIGDAQSIDRDLSTFSAHLLALRRFLEHARGEVLVLVDEIAVGTEPEQGASLGQAVLEELVRRGAQGIVTTHYERLKALAASDARFVNASVGFDLERMAPTFRLHLGVPGSSGALILARRMGLPAEVLAQAETLLGHGRAGVDELLTALTEERRRLDAERAATDQARRDAQRAQREAEHARHTLEERTKNLREKAHDSAVESLRDARDELDRLKKALRKKGADAGIDLAEARARLGELSAAVHEHGPAAPTVEGSAPPVEALLPGTRVVIAKLGGRGEVVAAPKGGRVTVQIGNLKTSVTLDELRLDTGKAQVATGPKDSPALRKARAAAAKKPAPRRDAGQAVDADGLETVRANDDMAPVRTASNTLDIRGTRVDEGLAELERFLDGAVLSAEDSVLIIHGHGTGALRAAVREALDAHGSVARTRPGRPEEGGDGVTVAWLE